MHEGSHSSSKVSSGALWPAAVPGRVVLRAGDVLHVPLSATNAVPAATVLPAGTAVQAGAALVHLPVEMGLVPVAPVAGRLGAVRSQSACATVELLPDAPADESAPEPSDRWHGSDPGALLDHLRRLGVAAHRHGSPDLLAQLEQALRRPIETVLCSALDPDPPLRVNAVSAYHHAVEVCEAVRTLADITGAGRCAVVVDQSSPALWLRELRAEARNRRIELIGMLNDYPNYDPSLLLLETVGRKLRPARLPVEQGVLLADASAMALVGAAIVRRSPATHRLIGVFDHFDRRVHYARAPVGLPWMEVLRQLKLATHRIDLHGGAILRQVKLPTDAVVDSGEAAIHLTATDDAPAALPCIRCAWCSQGCPVRIEPAGLLEAAQRKDRAMALRYGLDSCIECGICSYLCPSRLPLLQGIRLLRAGREGAS